MLRLALLLAVATARAQYIGSAACQPCHPEQSASQAKTAHAKALTKGGPEWAFGSGLQAVTYVSRIDDTAYLEHGLSHYTRPPGTAITPGHKSAQGVRYQTFAPDAAILRCFQCHSTGPLALKPGGELVPFEAGVKCEVCHGPSAEHAQSAGKIKPFTLKQATGTQVNEYCGACHRKPPATGEETDWGNAWNARHQPIYLNQSACFRKSEGRLTCLTCHDPHSSKLIDACRECHAGPRHRAATLVANKTCPSCHMPAVRPQPNLRFANHWIGIYASGNSLRPLASKGAAAPVPARK